MLLIEVGSGLLIEMLGKLVTFKRLIDFIIIRLKIDRSHIY